jgi:hypothetical protein
LEPVTPNGLVLYLGYAGIYTVNGGHGLADIVRIDLIRRVEAIEVACYFGSGVELSLTGFTRPEVAHDQLFVRTAVTVILV